MQKFWVANKVSIIGGDVQMKLRGSSDCSRESKPTEYPSCQAPERIVPKQKAPLSRAAREKLRKRRTSKSNL